MLQFAGVLLDFFVVDDGDARGGAGLVRFPKS